MYLKQSEEKLKIYLMKHYLWHTHMGGSLYKIIIFSHVTFIASVYCLSYVVICAYIFSIYSYIYVYKRISSASRISCDSLAIAHVWVSQHTHMDNMNTHSFVVCVCVSMFQFDKNKVDIFMLRMSLFFPSSSYSVDAVACSI